MTTPIEAETTRIEAALIEKYGERCEDFDPACATCLAWAELQRLTDPHILALRSSGAVKVKARKLAWKPFTSDEHVSFMFAATLGVRYEVFHEACDVAKIGIQVARMQHVDSLLCDDDECGDETTTIIGYGKSLDAAYAIAQADFESLVLSSIEPASPEAEKVTEGDYLVWSNEHRAWWREHSQGYARSILEAGRYTRAEAVDIADKSRNGRKLDQRPDEIAVAIADLPPPIRAALQHTPDRKDGGLNAPS